MSDNNKINALLKEVEVFTKKQDYASAFNLILEILEIDPGNKKALTEKQLLEEIIKFKNTDIFSSTNLFMDPWEE